MRITFLGTGTSTGVPVIGCRCGVCTSSDERNRRLRQSALVETRGAKILIDTTPDLRLQLLRHPVDWIDFILFTHSHADHMMGLDDIRPFNFFHRRSMTAFANYWTAEAIRGAFGYIWADTQPGGGKPKLDLKVVDGPFEFAGVKVVPIPVTHGEWTIFGYRIGDFAYITDTNGIPPASRELLRGVKVLALDGLRPSPHHPTHFTIGEAVKAAAELDPVPDLTYLIHLSHDVDHETVERTLPDKVRLAWDELVVELPEEGAS
jgi:phosphoribosyl 1,2-cyclic phosphate phosphodiesterase